jgi:hypothetical protein
LRHHPDSRCNAVKGIAVEIELPQPGMLALTYTVSGSIGALLLPPAAESVRADELWLHSCFEVFLKPGRETGYTEYNFASSLAWAAYRLDGYRKGRRPAEVVPPRLAAVTCDGRFVLEAVLQLPGEADWHLGLSAVIEEKGGRLSYWALVHPPGQPDFHHADCFALDLSAAWRP